VTSRSVDLERMAQAIELSRLCPPSTGAYSVGALLVDAHGVELATGYSREIDLRVHAEEAALAKLAGAVPVGATLYSTLEPCSQRSPDRIPCAELVLVAGIRRVVIAWREPSWLVANCQGVELLLAAGVDVIELHELEGLAHEVNAHLRPAPQPS
jgi:diaminohydroxyphosphoribosylaminopyrimidine deaminase / 5-amino-6-(5-phosphoribosylamino)uracil reductase